MPIEWVMPAVALLLLVWSVFVYRRLAAMRDAAVQAWSEIDALFRQRQDMISLLLRKIQGSLDPEGKSVRTLAEVRRLAANAQSPDAIGKAEAMLSTAIERVLGLAEAQAGLQTDADFRRLRSEFPEMENSIEASRRFFNEAVEDFNAARLGFPAAFLTYVVSFPPLEPLGSPKPVEPRAKRAVQRL